jgi:hypothetical protein
MLADAEYRKNDKQRWRGLLEQLLYHDNATNWWWVWHDLTGDRIKDIHPFIRMMLSNILSVITAVQQYATSIDSVQVIAFNQFTVAHILRMFQPRLKLTYSLYLCGQPYCISR